MLPASDGRIKGVRRLPPSHGQTSRTSGCPHDVDHTVDEDHLCRGSWYARKVDTCSAPWCGTSQMPWVAGSSEEWAQ
ncbi:hypothetical protein TYRP_016753 [Tyrophagus putrescentiae]|nr:hypothetical protein TYRP_016753 [Tyrophagus putrescentiae]